MDKIEMLALQLANLGQENPLAVVKAMGITHHDVADCTPSHDGIREAQTHGATGLELVALAAAFDRFWAMGGGRVRAED